jgi:hypothetical protein
VGVVVLGHYPEYIELAEQLRASCFNIPVEVWSRMSHEEQWEANRKFLDDAISSGDEILLATPLERLHIGSWYERELRYLASRGFRPDASARRLVLGSKAGEGAS